VKPGELRSALAKGRVAPLYLLAGDEPLLRDDALGGLRAVVLGDAPADFDFEQLRGEETPAARLRDAVRALPVMAPRRLVVLRDPEAARGGAARALAEALADVAPELAGQETTVLVVTSARPDRRARWVKALEREGERVECSAPGDARGLAAFLREEAARQGLELEAEAAGLLAERVGPQLLLLRRELEKASLLAGPGEAVTRRHVEQSVQDVAEQPIWDLTDAIGEGRAGDALALLARLQQGGAPAPVLLGTLAAHFRKLARLSAGGTVPGPPFVVRKLERQARRSSPARLVACLRAIHRADTAIKGAGALPPEMVIESLVLGLAR